MLASSITSLFSPISFSIFIPFISSILLLFFSLFCSFLFYSYLFFPVLFLSFLFLSFHLTTLHFYPFVSFSFLFPSLTGQRGVNHIKNFKLPQSYCTLLCFQSDLIRISLKLSLSPVYSRDFHPIINLCRIDRNAD